MQKRIPLKQALIQAVDAGTLISVGTRARCEEPNDEPFVHVTRFLCDHLPLTYVWFLDDLDRYLFAAGYGCLGDHVEPGYFKPNCVYATASVTGNEDRALVLFGSKYAKEATLFKLQYSGA